MPVPRGRHEPGVRASFSAPAMSDSPNQIKLPNTQAHTARGLVLLAMLHANALTDQTMSKEQMTIFKEKAFLDWPKKMQDQLRPFGAEIIGNENPHVSRSSIPPAILWPSFLTAEQEESILTEFKSYALHILRCHHMISRCADSLKAFIERCTNPYDLAMLSIYGHWNRRRRIAPESVHIYRPAVRLASTDIAWHPFARTQGEALLCWLEDNGISVATFNVDDIYGTGGIGPDGHYYEAQLISNALADFHAMREARMRPPRSIYPPELTDCIPLTFKGECVQLEFPFFPKFSLRDNDLRPIDKSRALLLLALLYDNRLSDLFINPEEWWSIRYREYHEWPNELRAKLWDYGAGDITSSTTPTY